MNHLTDEQLAGWLAGEADPETGSHLESCAQCDAEARELRDGISRYSIAMRRQAAHAQMAHLSRNLAPSKALARQRTRWVVAGVLVLVLAGQTAWLVVKSGPRPPAARLAAHLAGQSAAHLAAQSAAQPARPTAIQLSDDELLEAVNNDLSREVPLALAPVSAITTGRNRMAASAIATSAGSASR